MRVTLTNLGHRFGALPWVFQNLNTVFLPGTITGLTGPSGSGKSTLLSLITGWATPTTGTITIEGVTKTNWVFQNSHGVARRTVSDHLLWPLLARGVTGGAAHEESHRLLDMFLLESRAALTFSALSGGEAQRLMLARALAAHPQLLLIDEPTAQLDRGTAALVNTCVRNVAHQDCIVIIATHDHDTMQACDSVFDLATAAQPAP